MVSLLATFDVDLRVEIKKTRLKTLIQQTELSNLAYLAIDELS